MRKFSCRLWGLASGVLLCSAGCGSLPGDVGEVDEEATSTAETAEALFWAADVITWNHSPGGPTTISVCYETEGTLPTPPSVSDVVGDIRDLLERTWGHYANIDFTGWSACTGSERLHLRLLLHNTRLCAGCSNLGQPATGAPGDYTTVTLKWDAGPTILAFDYSLPWQEALERQRFARSRVMHEFGHALGFAHDHDHPGNFDSNGFPRYCEDAPSRFEATHGVPLTGDFDPWSQMSYCANTEYDWRGDVLELPVSGEIHSTGRLSYWDIRGSQDRYGERPGAGAWLNAVGAVDHSLM